MLKEECLHRIPFSVFHWLRWQKKGGGEFPLGPPKGILIPLLLSIPCYSISHLYRGQIDNSLSSIVSYYTSLAILPEKPFKSMAAKIASFLPTHPNDNC